MPKTFMNPAPMILLCLITFLIGSSELQAGLSSTASVQKIRCLEINGNIRVVIDLDSQTHYEKAQLTNPDRIFFDLLNTKFHNDLKYRTLSVEDALLKRVRAAQYRSDVVRVVLDLSDAADYLVSEQQSPFRIVIDLTGKTGTKAGVTSALRVSEPDKAAPAPKSVPARAADDRKAQAPSAKIADPEEGKPNPASILATGIASESQSPAPIPRATIRDIRYLVSGSNTRVFIDLDSNVEYRNARVTGPDRIYVDISNSRLAGGFPRQKIPTGARFLKRIRSAQNRSDTVRVVLDVEAKMDYRVYEQQDPFSIVIDLQNQPDKKPESIIRTPEFKPIASGFKQTPQAIDSFADREPARLEADSGSVSGNYWKPKPQKNLAKNVAAVSQSPAAKEVALVESVRFSTSGGHTRVFIELDANAQYESARISGPERVYFDITKSRLSRTFQNHAVAAGGRFLKLVRAGQNRPDVVRVVLYVTENTKYNVSELQDPFSIVIDLHDTSSSLMAGEEPNGGDQMVQITRPSPDLDQAAGSINYIERAEQQHTVFLERIASSADEIGRETIPEDRHFTPISITGVLSTGYYSSFNRGGGNENQKVNFVPAGSTFDIKGAYRSPDLIDYSIKTELNAGAQASDAGFVGGNGVRASVTTLRRGAFPLTFRYSNVQLEDVYFGSLTQVSSYTMKNHNKDLGLTAGIRLPGLPSATVDLGTNSIKSQTFNPLIPDYNSQFKHMNVNCSDQRWGWNFQCFFGRQSQTSDLFTPQSVESSTSLLQQELTQYRASARRSLFSGSELYLEGGSQHTDNFVLNRPIDLATRYVSANLRMFQRSKWKSSLRAGYTSNIASILFTQLVGGLGSNGSIAPDETILQPFQRTTSYFNINGITSVDLSQGFGMFGSVDRTAVFTPGGNDFNSTYLTTGGGITYARAFGWGSLSGQYGRTLGTGSMIGQKGRVIGQNYIVTAQPGNPEGFQFDLTVRGSDQKVRYDIPAQEHSFASEIGMAFPVHGGWRARIGGGLQRGVFSNEGNEFKTRGYTAQVAVEHPRFQLSGSLNSSFGNSLQSYSQMYNQIGMDAAFLSPKYLVPSDLQGVTLTLHAIPFRRLEVSALFSRSIQHIEGIISNDFQILDVSAKFRYRRLQFEAGYFRSTQVYSSFLSAYPETERGRFYIRISRPFKLR